MQNSNKQTIFKLVWFDKLDIYFALLVQLFAVFVLLFILKNFFLIPKSIALILLSLIFILAFMAIVTIKLCIDAICCNCKSVSVDTINNKFIIKVKKSSLVEIPFDNVNQIIIASKRGVHMHVDFIDICTTNGENYRTAVTPWAVKDFCELLPKDIKIKKL